MYASDGEFVYGYSFSCNQSFGIEFDGDDIIIYFVRSDVAASFDENGNNTDARLICNSASNNSYWNNYVRSPRRIIGNAEYRAMNGGGIFGALLPTYSRIARIPDNGDETVVYSADGSYTARIVVLVVLSVAFVASSLCAIASLFVTLRRDRNEGKTSS